MRLPLSVHEQVGARVVDDPGEHAEERRGEGARDVPAQRPRASSRGVRSTEVSHTASSTKNSVCTSNESAYGRVARLGQREHRAEREERQRERGAGRHRRAEAERPDERQQHADAERAVGRRDGLDAPDREQRHAGAEHRQRPHVAEAERARRRSRGPGSSSVGLARRRRRAARAPWPRRDRCQQDQRGERRTPAGEGARRGRTSWRASSSRRAGHECSSSLP